MPFGRDAGRRRQAAEAHANRRHHCKCGRVIMGNAYYRHRQTCALYLAHASEKAAR